MLTPGMLTREERKVCDGNFVYVQFKHSFDGRSYDSASIPYMDKYSLWLLLEAFNTSPNVIGFWVYENGVRKDGKFENSKLNNVK